MDMVIKTGFEKVTHSINFNPGGIIKGKKLVESNHVQKVQEFRSDGISFLIRAYVIRQTTISSNAYKVEIHIDTHRHVKYTTYECVANQSGKCKHIYALIHYLNCNESLTKTSFEQEWGKATPRQLGTEKYSKGAHFHQMFPPKLKQEVPVYEFILEDLEGPSPLRSALIQEKKDKAKCFIESLLNELMKKICVISENKLCDVCINNLLIFQEESDLYSDSICHANSLEHNLKEYYQKHIVLNESEMVELCMETLNQSDCSKWFNARRVRLSASQNVHDIKVLKKKSFESLVNNMLNPSKINTPSMRYGIKNEIVALDEYMKLYGVTVIRLGVLLRLTQPWLCASVDGIVIKDASIFKLVEIKCPSSCETKQIIDYENKKSNVQYLYFNGDIVDLKSSSKYYTQIQVQMYVTGLTVCDLYVYSPLGSCCIEVHKDDNFLKSVIPICESFYFKYYLKAVYTNYNLRSGPEIDGNNECFPINTNTRSFTGIDIQNSLNSKR